jgi:hypothetical protein
MDQIHQEGIARENDDGDDDMEVDSEGDFDIENATRYHHLIYRTLDEIRDICFAADIQLNNALVRNLPQGGIVNLKRKLGILKRYIRLNMRSSTRDVEDVLHPYILYMRSEKMCILAERRIREWKNKFRRTRYSSQLVGSPESFTEEEMEQLLRHQVAMKDIFDEPGRIFQRDYDVIMLYYGRRLNPITQVPLFYRWFVPFADLLIENGVLNGSTPMHENEILLMDMYPDRHADYDIIYRQPDTPVAFDHNANMNFLARENSGLRNYYCAICADDHEVASDPHARVPGCGHPYCVESLNRLVHSAEHPVCPQCRIPIRRE